MKENKTSECITKNTVVYDEVTGEVFSVATEYATFDVNWVKVWIEPLFETLTQLTPSQLRVACFVLSNTRQKSNMFFYSARRISDYLNVSEDVVNEALRILRKNDFIRKIDISRYMLNPMLVYYGKDNKELAKKFYRIKNTYGKKVAYHPYAWRKIWIKNFFPKIQNLSGKNLLVVLCLLRNANNRNEVRITQSEIVEKTGLCIQTVNRTMQKLFENQFFVKRAGYILLDPNSIARVKLDDRVYIKADFEQNERYL